MALWPNYNQIPHQKQAPCRFWPDADQHLHCTNSVSSWAHRRDSKAPSSVEVALDGSVTLFAG
jgi:hypothetical protein